MEISNWNYFREIFKFRDFMNTLMISRNTLLSITSRNKKYFAKVITCSKSPDYVPQSYINVYRYSMLIF